MEKETKKENQFLKKLFFKKYKLLKLLSTNSINYVFEGINVNNNKKVALKLEDKIRGKNTLTNESYFLLNLKHRGIPELISFGHSGQYNVLIEELLGKTLQELFEQNDNEIPIKDICMIAIQILERIEFIHSKYIVHRNINPNNFLIGLNNSSLIYIIDFANAKKYRSSVSRKHIKFNLNQKVYGEISFISINAMRGGEQSRKDDLESIGYMLIYLLKGFLPWKEFENKNNKILKIYELKKKIPLSRLCKYTPEEIKNYMEYCKNLSFEQDPNYKYLKGLFTQILIKMQKINDNIFFWNKNKKEEKKKIIFKRRKSPPFILLKEISSSLNKSINNKSLNAHIPDRTNYNNNMKLSKNEFDILPYIERFREQKNLKNSNKFHTINNKHIQLNHVSFDKKKYVYKKKNNLISINNPKRKILYKKNMNLHIDINNDNNKNTLTYRNNNSMINLELSKSKKIPISLLSLKKNKVKEKLLIPENNEKFRNNKKIIRLKENYSFNKNNLINMKEKENNSYNFTPKCNIYKEDIKSFKNNKINYNNQNYIDNINIIGYLKNLNENKINNYLSNSINQSNSYNNILKNNINKEIDININNNCITSRNDTEKYCVKPDFDPSLYNNLSNKNKINISFSGININQKEYKPNIKLKKNKTKNNNRNYNHFNLTKNKLDSIENKILRPKKLNQYLKNNLNKYNSKDKANDINEKIKNQISANIYNYDLI